MIFRPNKRVLSRNVFGIEVDYSHYQLSRNEQIFGFSIGCMVTFITVYVFFHSFLIGLILGVPCGFISITHYQSYLIKKQGKSLLLQFSDLLDSLSNSYSAGRNTMGAFQDSYNDLRNQYGEKAIIVYEIRTILMGLENNFTIEELLDNFAERSHLDDVKSFVNTFNVCNRNGGNQRKVVTETRAILNEKIEIQMEIETKILEKKNELYIMLVMPLIVVAMLGTLGSETITNNSPVNIGVKLAAIILFILSFQVGRRITDIKI